MELLAGPTPLRETLPEDTIATLVAPSRLTPLVTLRSPLTTKTPVPSIFPFTVRSPLTKSMAPDNSIS